jgi:cell division inhibitor SepF
MGVYMGLLDELKRLARPYDDEDYESFTPRASERIPVSAAQQQPSGSGFDMVDKKNKVVNIHATAQLQVVLVKPERFENSTEIADHLRDKRTVVINLESTNKDVARRVLDFLSGVAYAQDGKIKKVAVSTYIYYTL